MIYKSYKKMFGVNGCKLELKEHHIQIDTEHKDCYIINDDRDVINYFKYSSLNECFQTIRNTLELLTNE